MPATRSKTGATSSKTSAQSSKTGAKSSPPAKARSNKAAAAKPRTYIYADSHVGDIPTVFDKALAKGVEWFVHQFAPGIIRNGSPTFLRSLAIHVAKACDEDRISPADVALLRPAVTQFLAASIESADFFDKIRQVRVVWGWNAPPPLQRGEPEIARSYIAACIDTDNKPLIPSVFDRLLESNNYKDYREVHLPLIHATDASFLERNPDLTEQWRRFCRQTVKTHLEMGRSHKETLSNNIWSGELWSAIAACDDADIFSKTLFPCITSIEEGFVCDESRFRDFVESMHKHRVKLYSDPSVVDAAIHQLVEHYARNVTTEWSMILRNTTTGGPQHEIRRKLAFCFAMGGMDCGAILLDRLLDPAASADTKYISYTLVALVPELHALAAEHGAAPTSAPFAPAFRRIVELFVEQVLGGNTARAILKKHYDELAEWACECDHCDAVKLFLSVKTKSRAAAFAAPLKFAKHVKKLFEEHISETFATCDHIDSRPQGLMVTKERDALAIPEADVAANRHKAFALLKAVSEDEGVLQNIFGQEEYAALLRTLNAAPADSPPAAMDDSDSIVVPFRAFDRLDLLVPTGDVDQDARNKARLQKEIAGMGLDVEAIEERLQPTS